MNILFLEPFGQHEGHPPIESKRVTDALTKIGMHVTIVTFDGVRGDWAKNTTMMRHISVTSVAGPFRPLLRAVPMFRRILLVRLLEDLLETVLVLLLSLMESRRNQYDAIHIFDWFGPIFIAPFLCSLLTKNRRYVVNVYFPPPEYELDTAFNRMGVGDNRYRMHLTLLRLANTRVAKAAQTLIYREGLERNSFRFICHTSELKDAYRTHLGGIFYDRIQVIPLGRDPPEIQRPTQEDARKHLQLPEDKTVLLCFGTNHYGKDWEVIFKAVQDLPKSYCLLFAGKLTEDTVRDPRLLARKYRLVEDTRVVDKFIAEREKPYYFCAADACVLSHVGGLLESVSVLNEAAQFSVPVIASDVGQLGMYVKQYNLGKVFTAGDPVSLKQVIRFFLDAAAAEPERRRVEDAFTKFASDLSWDAVAARYVCLYSRDCAVYPRFPMDICLSLCRESDTVL